MLTVAELFAKLRLKLDEESWKKGETAIAGVKGLLAGIGLTAAAARGAVEALVAHTATAALETSKAAQRVGMARERFQELDEAAKHSGVDDFETSIKFLNRALYEATHGGGEARKEFRALGIEVTRSTKVGDVFAKIVDRFSTMEDGPKKVALAMKLFGRSGTDMLPFLNKGNEGIEKMIEHAHALGLIFSDEDVAAAKAYKLANLDLKMSLEGLERTIGRKLLPEAGKIARAMAEWIAANREWISTNIAQAVDLARAAWKRATTTLEPLFKIVKFLATNTLLWKVAIAGVAVMIAVQFGHAVRDAATSAWKLVAAVRAITSAQLLGAAASVATGLLWAAGIALVLAAVEELYGWITGDRETLLERWLGKFDDFMKGKPGDSDFANGIRTLIDLFSALGSAAKTAVEWVGKIRRMTGFSEETAEKVSKHIASGEWKATADAGAEAERMGLGWWDRWKYVRQKQEEWKNAHGPAAAQGGGKVSVTFGDINVSKLPDGANMDDLKSAFGEVVDEKLRGILDPAYEAVQR